MAPARQHLPDRLAPRTGSLGLAALAAIARGPCPVIAIGGITPARAAAVHQAGAFGVAAITALWDAADPAAAATAMLAPWREAA
ncbi:MAG: thiamine phosphate synthase [Gemmatimonadetes bacterium]|nr:thiamine phosphate synthase [Gemmatimonadota bacterium]